MLPRYFPDALSARISRGEPVRLISPGEQDHDAVRELARWTFMVCSMMSACASARRDRGLVGPNGAGNPRWSRPSAVSSARWPAASYSRARSCGVSDPRTHRPRHFGRARRGGLFANMSVEENLMMGGYPLAARRR